MVGDVAASAEFDVLVVGAGPVGLTLANLLGLYGVSTCVVERRDGLLGIPRAVALDDEGMRILQMAGLADRVAPHMLMGYDHWLFGRKGQALLRIDPREQEYGFPKRNRFHQPLLEQALVEGLDRFAHVQLRFSSELVGFRYEGGSVRAEVAGDAGTIAARFIVGADGGGSVVRRLAGIEMTGESHPEPWIVIDTENNDDAARYSRVIADPARPSVSVPGSDGRRRYEFMLLPHEDPERAVDDDNVRTLLAPHCDLTRVSIARSTVYTFHSLIAEHFSQNGMLFLVGDAAHMMPPFQGQGMNSGMRDAAMLGWRLAAAVRGQAGTPLLESYEQERRPHAEDMIQLSHRVGSILMTRSRWRAVLRDWFFHVAAVLPASRRYLRTMGFKPKPRVRRGFFLADTGAIAGQMLPQPDMLGADGRKVDLDSALGHGFALIHFVDRIEDPVIALDHPLWSRLAPRRVLVLPGGIDRPGNAGEVVVGDIAATLRTMTRAEPGDTIVVRPDRYVAAIMTPSTAHQVADRLTALL